MTAVLDRPADYSRPLALAYLLRNLQVAAVVVPSMLQLAALSTVTDIEDTFERATGGEFETGWRGVVRRPALRQPFQHNSAVDPQ